MVIWRICVFHFALAFQKSITIEVEAEAVITNANLLCTKVVFLMTNEFKDIWTQMAFHQSALNSSLEPRFTGNVLFCSTHSWKYFGEHSLLWPSSDDIVYACHLIG